MAADLDYINARLRGMHSRMLQANDWAELVKAETIERLFSLLATSEYQNAIEETAGQGTNLLALDQALALHWQAILSKLQSFIEGKPALVLRTELWHLDLLNLLRLVGFRASGTTPPDEAVPLTGTISHRQLEDLSQCANWKEMGKLLSLWHHPLAEAVARLPENPTSTLPSETALSKAFFEVVQRSFRGSLSPITRDLSRYWRAWVDDFNLRAVFILRELPPGDISAADVFLPGGATLTLKDFLALSDPSSSQYAWQRLARFPWSRFAMKCKTPGELEQQLARRKMQTYQQMIRRQPLRIGVLLTYLFEKETEVANLRLIGRAIVYGLDPVRVKENLLVPSLPAH